MKTEIGHGSASMTPHEEGGGTSSPAIDTASSSIPPSSVDVASAAAAAAAVAAALSRSQAAQAVVQAQNQNSGPLPHMGHQGHMSAATHGANMPVQVRHVVVFRFGSVELVTKLDIKLSYCGFLYTCALNPKSALFTMLDLEHFEL